MKAKHRHDEEENARDSAEETQTNGRHADKTGEGENANSEAQLT